VIESGIVRAGAVRTDGGTVSLIGGEVHASGSIDVSSATGAAGSVDIFGDLQAGSVALDGKVDARGATRGGKVETSAARVKAGSGARVSTLSPGGRHGTWLIDPQDYTIGDAPGDDISGAVLSGNLEQGNVTIQSVAGVRSGAGDIHVNAPVSWGADTTLTLTAENSILFASGAITDPFNPNLAARANMSASGDSPGLVLNFGNRYALGENKITMSGVSPRVTINGAPFTIVNEFSPDALAVTARLNLGGNYVLTTDLDASETAFDNNGLGWEPLGTAATPFSGQLHGFGHVVGGLTINRSTSDVGLIGALTGTVRDLGMVDPDIVGGQSTGALVGSVRSANASILNTYVAGGSVGSSGGNSAVGGLVGSLLYSSSPASRGVIDSSYTSGVSVSGGFEGNGLIGQSSVTGGDDLRNSFYNASDELYGDVALGPGAVLGGQFYAWLAGGRNLQIADYAASLPYDVQTDSHGLGSVQGMRDLLGFANAGVKLRLTGDLDLSGEPGLFLPTFNGQLDGANHTISNLTLEASDRVAYAGLVGINTGTIRNLNLTDARLTGQVVGGIAGANLGTIQNTSVSGALVGNDSVGGLVGFQYGNGQLLDSASTANITANSSFGGVIGDFDSGTLRNTHYNADTVLVNGSTASLSMGGLRGGQYDDWNRNGRRLDIANYADVLPRDPASGEYLVSNVAGVNALLGFADDPALRFRLNADIDLAAAPGLFLPYLMGTLDGNGHRISNLNLIAPKQQYLGLVGVNYGTVRNLGVTNAAVDGYYYVGGLVGRNQAGARIETSFTSGTVSSEFSGAGGLAGANFGEIGNSYSNASANGESTSNSVGGLAGFNAGMISNSLSTGAVGGGGNGRGGLVGLSRGSVTNSFWNTETSGRATSAGGTGKTTAELASLATYTGWEFGSTWRMADGGPLLRTLSAGQYDLVIDALDLRRIYGAGPIAAQDLSVSVTGLQGSDTLAQLIGQLAYSGDGIGAINAGSYSVLAGGLTSAKYDIVYQPGTVTIDKAPLTLTADNKSKVYGDPDPALSFSASGLRYADTVAVVSGVALNAPQGPAAGAGTHAITISGGSAANYTIAARTPGQLTVARRPLLLSADDKTIPLNGAAVELTYSASGFAYNDTIDLVDAGFSIEGAGSSALPGSRFPIILVDADAGPNYAVSTVNGTATVTGVADGAEPVPVQSLMLAPATLTLPRVPDASAAGSVALAASIAGGATPQRKELFVQAGDAITRDPSIGSLKTCGEAELGDCIARPRMAYRAQVTEDTGGAAPAMHIKRKLALVIGNNDYHSPLSRLEGAGRDAQAVAALLRQQGYEVDQLADADRSTMIASLNRLIRTTEPDDSVLVFYAGHGYIHPGSSVGYWIPTGANVDDPRGWLSNIDIARFLANMAARQLLLVSDSCFSGALTREGIAAEQRAGMSRNAILMRRSVVALSSGGEEVVADSALDGHSPFTYHLLRQLGEAQGEIPARDMLLSIRDKVSKSSAGQVPAYGIILSSGHASGGEYLLNPKTN
jgi:hypothetical protein